MNCERFVPHNRVCNTAVGLIIGVLFTKIVAFIHDIPWPYDVRMDKNRVVQQAIEAVWGEARVRDATSPRGNA
jgi:large-conductance mechanosensitive channel